MSSAHHWWTGRIVGQVHEHQYAIGDCPNYLHYRIIRLSLCNRMTMLKVCGHLAPFQPPTRNPLRSPRTHLRLTSAMFRASSIPSFLDRIWEHATAAWLGNSHARRIYLATTVGTRSPTATLSTGCKTCRLCEKPDVLRPGESSLQLVEFC